MVIIEKNKTKLEVFKLTANTVPNTTPIATNAPKVLTILKSTALNFMCVIVDIIDVGIIQKMTPNGQSTRFKALVAAGNENGWLGIGMGKSKQMRIAIEKANNAAYLNVSPVKLGCGSWECRCDQKHSVPFKVKGKGGSVTIEILPGPRGLGLVAGGKIRDLLQLAGLKDAWTTAKGSTATMNSTSKALLNCLRQTFSQG